MPASLSDLLSSRADRGLFSVTFNSEFCDYKWKSIGIFVALISFSSLANADCSEAFATKLMDNKFSPTQIMDLCGKVTSQPSTGGTNTGVTRVEVETKLVVDAPAAVAPAADQKAEKNDKTPPVPKAVISSPAKDITFEGDYIYIGNEVNNFTDINSGTKNITAKAGTKFHVDKEQKQVDGTHKLVVTRSDCEASDKIVKLFDSEYQCVNSTQEDEIQDHRIYSIKKEEIMYGNYLHRGFGWGILVSPFKFYPKGKTLAPGNSIGPYLSYIYDKPGVSFGPAVSLSYTSLPVTTIQNGVSNTTNQSGLTVAAGFLIRIKDQFTVGFMAGRDYIDSQYKYNGATWFGANFGYELGQ